MLAIVSSGTASAPHAEQIRGTGSVRPQLVQLPTFQPGDTDNWSG
ncbi:MAG TPA: hypothetical protein VIU15_20100 [Streptomyces sp.]